MLMVSNCTNGGSATRLGDDEVCSGADGQSAVAGSVVRGAMRVALSIALVLPVAGCHAPPLRPDPHYVLGPPYQSGKIWHYPKDRFDLDETGLAAVIDGDAPRLTTDGEVFDQTAVIATHPTLQLPAIARLTNLENGREVIVRLNDRGSGNPGRLVEVTKRTAELLGFPPSGVARVHMRLLPSESHAAVEGLRGAPTLAILAVPRGVVEVTVLPPIPGVRQGNGRALHAPSVVAPEPAPMTAPALRLPEIVTQTAPHPGRMIVRLDTFSESRYAASQCAKMGWPNARIVSILEGRARRFRAESGPLPDVARADAVLRQALSAGIPDARIVVD